MAKEESKQNECPRDCAKCNVFQRNYCAATMARNTQDMVAMLSAEVRQLRERVDALMTNGDIVPPPLATNAPASEAQ